MVRTLRLDELGPQELGTDRCAQARRVADNAGRAGLAQRAPWCDTPEWSASEEEIRCFGKREPECRGHRGRLPHHPVSLWISWSVFGR